MNGLFDRPTSLGQPLVVDRPASAFGRRLAQLIERDLIEIVGHNL